MITEGFLVFMCAPGFFLENSFDVTEWWNIDLCFHSFFFFCFYNKAHGDVTLSYNIIMLSEDKILKREKYIERERERETAPLVSLLRYPHPSQEQLIERSHILLDFCLLFFFIWSPVPLQFLRMSA